MHKFSRPGVRRIGSCVSALFSSGISVLAFAQNNLMIYPKSGQSSEQQARDQAECQSWATQQSCYNPAATGTERGSVLRDGARGATAGGLEKGFQRRNQQQAAQSGASNYDRALKSCLEGRGCSVI